MAYAGTVKSLDPQKGWGFIACQDTFQLLGKDVFFLRGQCAAPVAAGASVTFTLVEGDKGPEARDVLPVEQGNHGAYTIGVGSRPADTGRHEGVARWRNLEKGYGFISCAQLGREFFFLRGQCAGPIEEGASVTFTIVEGPKGPEAREVQPVGPGSHGSSMTGIEPAFGDTERHEGVARWTNLAKGYGFIACEQLGRDFFFLKGQCEAPVAEGASVTFTIVEGPKGPEARAVQPVEPASRGTPVTGIEPAPTDTERHEGVARWTNVARGYGFIACEQLGRDFFFLRGQCAAPITEGAKVTFTIVEGPKGPEAREVQPSAGAGRHQGVARWKNVEKGYGFIACEQLGRQFFFLRGQCAAPVEEGTSVTFTIVEGPKGPEAREVQPSAAAGRLQGVAKWKNIEKGFGFISCEQLGKEFFFLRGQCVVPVEEGALVTFTIVHGPKGPEAREVQPVGQGGLGAPARGLAGGGLAARRVGAHAARVPGAAPAGGGRDMGGQTFVGTVKGWNEEKGFGHIACDAARGAHGRDIFFTRSVMSFGRPEVGTLVCVKTIVDAKGPRAESVRPLPVEALGCQVFSGQVTSFNQAKGWGFVSGPEVLEIFGKDIFLRQQELSGGVPQVGDSVQFTVDVSSGGQLHAKDVLVLGPAASEGAEVGFTQPSPSVPRYAPY